MVFNNQLLPESLAPHKKVGARATMTNKFAREIARMRRIEGQARGIIRMMQDERYCIDILQQLAAMEAALRAARMKFLNIHAKTCVEEVITSQDKAEQSEKLSELIALFEKMGR
jgi:CsoR family transcriptional regulator, copper-sensing transcriptional repressor